MTKRNPENPSVLTRTAYLDGGMRVIVQQQAFGYTATLIGRTGQRAPISFGTHTPTDIEDALAAAVRSVKDTAHAQLRAAPRVTKPYTSNSAAKRPSDRATAILNERRQWRGSAGERFADIGCGCAGYDTFMTEDGIATQACDECNAAANRVGLPVLSDHDVRELAGAERGRRGMRAMLERPRMRHWRGNPASAHLEDAKAKFEEFHSKPPRKIGEFARDFTIPGRVGELGKAIHVLYRSDKKDPATGKQPKKTVDYIHEHYAGVKAYQCDNDELAQVDVPAFIAEADALVLLGQCLGFRFKDDDGEHDAEGDEPLPELYCTPCGKALLVIQSKREVLAMIWGGGLGVWARGIDG